MAQLELVNSNQFRMNKSNWVMVAIMLLWSSCTLIRIEGSIELGNQYRYVQDFPQAIIYHPTTAYQGGGIYIIPPLVTAYAFNDRYIIVKSNEIDIETGRNKGIPIQYWIVDKQGQGQSVEPLDSIGFEQTRRDLNIQLQF